MSKHTPGPWRFTSHPYDGNYMRIHFSVAPNEDAKMGGYCGEANARLIAAAPELYEALDSLSAVIGLTPVVGNKEALQEAYDNARAALAKARGES